MTIYKILRMSDWSLLGCVPERRKRPDIEGLKDWAESIFGSGIFLVRMN